MHKQADLRNARAQDADLDLPWSARSSWEAHLAQRFENSKHIPQQVKWYKNWRFRPSQTEQHWAYRWRSKAHENLSKAGQDARCRRWKHIESWHALLSCPGAALRGDQTIILSKKWCLGSGCHILWIVLATETIYRLEWKRVVLADQLGQNFHHSQPQRWPDVTHPEHAQQGAKQKTDRSPDHRFWLHPQQGPPT